MNETPIELFKFATPADREIYERDLLLHGKACVRSDGKTIPMEEMFPVYQHALSHLKEPQP